MTFDEIDEIANPEGLDFSDLPLEFCVRTAKAMLKIAVGYSTSWRHFYEHDGMADAAKDAVKEKSLEPIWFNKGAIHGAEIVGNSMQDDWNQMFGKST